MKSGPWWCCWRQAYSVSRVISSCVRGLCQVSASNLSFKIITIRKLGPSKPSQVLTLFCCWKMSYWVSLSGESGKRPVELKRKENQGPRAPSSSQCGHKCVCWNTLRETSTFLIPGCVCWNTLRETSTFLIPGKSKSAFWPAPLTVDLVQLNILHVSWDKAERNLVDSLLQIYINSP